MLKVYGIIGIALLLIFVVRWVERGAVARFELHNLAHAAQVKDHSLADVQERSQQAMAGHQTELTAASKTIRSLRAEAEALRQKAAEVEQLREQAAEVDAEVELLREQVAAAAETPETDGYCIPGCKYRWGGQELVLPQSP